jgi:hypothetical protein
MSYYKMGKTECTGRFDLLPKGKRKYKTTRESTTMKNLR